MTAASNRPEDPLAAAIRLATPAAGDRPFRLFNCACVRRVFHLLRDERFRTAIKVAERHADGLASAAELGQAVREVKRASGRRQDQDWAVYRAVRYKPGSPREEAANVAARTAAMAGAGVPVPGASVYEAWARADTVRRGFLVTWEQALPDGRTIHRSFGSGDALPEDVPPEVAEHLAEVSREAREADARAAAERRRDAVARDLAHRAEAERGEAAGRAAYAAERAAQLRLLHDILGPPDPPPFDPASRTTAVIALAGSIYADRAFGRMPALAGALAAAGCREPAVLDHCRAGGEHARGCWVLDGLLGRR